MPNNQESIKRVFRRFIAVISILLIGIPGHSQNSGSKDSIGSQVQFVIEGGDTTYLKADINPMYPGGDSAWKKFLIKTLHYPIEAIGDEIQGIVWVQFAVDEQGSISDVKIISGPKKGGLREEAIRVMNLSGRWMPAVRNGREVRAYAKKSFEFKIVK